MQRRKEQASRGLSAMAELLVYFCSSRQSLTDSAPRGRCVVAEPLVLINIFITAYTVVQAVVKIYRTIQENIQTACQLRNAVYSNF